MQTRSVMIVLRSRTVAFCSSVALLAGLATTPAIAQSRVAHNTATTSSSAQVDPLNDLVDRTIALTSRRYLDANAHTPWQMLHGLLALRNDFVVREGSQHVNALDWIADRGSFRGVPWIEATPDGGRLHPYNGTPYEFEGHVNQSLAIISMCNLPLDFEFKTSSGQVVTMQQMVDHAKKHVNNREEITWTLWFLTRYVDQDEEWLNKDNEAWSMERLVRMQVQATTNNAACGGTHGMFALAYARNSYLKKHGELRGVWLEADQKLQRYLTTSQRLQNRDGSFSTNWFNGTGYSTDISERLTYSGHTVEWMVVALPKSRLREQWVRNGVQTLCNDLIQSARVPIDGKKVGGLYHALHALVLYREQANPTVAAVEPPVLSSTPAEEVAKESRPATPDASVTANGGQHVITNKPEVISTPVVLPQRSATPTPVEFRNGRYSIPMPIRLSEMSGNSEQQVR